MFLVAATEFANSVCCSLKGRFTLATIFMRFRDQTPFANYVTQTHCQTCNPVFLKMEVKISKISYYAKEHTVHGGCSHDLTLHRRCGIIPHEHLSTEDLSIVSLEACEAISISPTRIAQMVEH